MILPRCFDFRDRLNRKGYWHWYVLSLLVIGIGAVIAMMIGLLGFGTPELRLNLILSCYLVTALMVLSIQVPITVQRLHDIGKSGWYASSISFSSAWWCRPASPVPHLPHGSRPIRVCGPDWLCAV